MKSETTHEGTYVSVTGGVSPRLHAIVDRGRQPEDLSGIHLGAENDDVDWINKLQAENEEFASRNNRGPTIVLSSGYYKKGDGETVPSWVARLGCGTCGYHKIYDGWAQMTQNIPTECQALPELYEDCPMRRGKMKRQYDRANS